MCLVYNACIRLFRAADFKYYNYVTIERKYLYEKHRGGSTRATVLFHPAKHPTGLQKYDGHGEYCDLNTASEVFLIFTTKLYSCLCNCNAILFIS